MHRLTALIFTLMLCVLPGQAWAQGIYGSSGSQSPGSQSARTNRSVLQLPAGWKVFKGQGIVAPYPPGWRMQERANGGLLGFLPGPSGGAQAMVLVQPMQVQGRAAGVLDELGRIFPDLLPSARASRQRGLSREPQVAVCRLDYKAGGRDFIGEALCFVQAGRGVVYAMCAEPGVWGRARPQMFRMLHGFFYRAKQGRGQGGGPAALPPMTTFRDQAEGAFTVPVPQGWNVQGGLRRYHAVDVRPEVLAISPDKTMLIRLGDAWIPPMVVPNQMLMMAGKGQGSWYSPGYGLRMLVMPYLPGAQFGVNFYLPQRVQGLSQVRPRNLPQLASRIQAVYAGTGLPVRVDIGEAHFDATWEGGPAKGYLLCQTKLVQAPGGGAATWYVERLFGYLARPAAKDRARAILNAMAAGFKINPTWLARQVQTAGQVSGIVARTTEQISSIVQKAFENRQRAQDRSAERFSRYIRDQVLIEDPQTGERFEVPSGGNYYWRAEGQDAFTATETADRPRHPNHWLEQMRVVD